MSIPSTIRQLFDAAESRLELAPAVDAALLPNGAAFPPFPVARLPMAANAARNLSRDLDTHLPERMSEADHATVARLIAAKALQEAAAYAWLAHTLATEPSDWAAIIGRIEALVNIEQDMEMLKVELLRHRMERLSQAMSAQLCGAAGKRGAA